MLTLPPPYNTLQPALDQPTALDLTTGATPAWHRWSEAEVLAVAQAWASRRPLLVRGEPGCGKSQLARAAAHVLGVPLITEVIHPRYEASDLLYQDDPVRRLAKAQLLAATRQSMAGGKLSRWLRQALDPREFVTDGPLTRAMRQAPPARPADLPQAAYRLWPRAVVLIDEIDKADSDVPNALLAAFGDRSFRITPTGEEVRCDEAHRPLVLITTNEDRELPPAFVRRCAVLNLRTVDDDETAFITWLRERVGVHPVLLGFMAAPKEVTAKAGQGQGAGKGRRPAPPDPIDSPDPTVAPAAPAARGVSVFQRAAAQVWRDRQAALQESLPTVGLAECLDLLQGLHELSGGDVAQAHALLDRIAPYALVKHRHQDQAREPVQPD